MQRDRAALVGELAVHARHHPHGGGRPVVGEHQQQLVAGFQVAAAAGDLEAVGLQHVVERDVLRLLQAHLQVVPFALRLQVVAGLEGLRLLARVGNALRARAGGDRHRLFLVVVQRVGQVGRRGDARAQLVAHQTGQFQHRAPLGGGAQIGLVGDPLLVEAQHVAHRRPGVEQGDRRVAGVTGGQALQRAQVRQRLPIGTLAIDFQGRQPRLHRFQEAAMRADTVVQRGQAGTVVHALRRQHLHAVAATARLRGGAADHAAAGHAATGGTAHDGSPKVNEGFMQVLLAAT